MTDFIKLATLSNMAENHFKIESNARHQRYELCSAIMLELGGSITFQEYHSFGVRIGNRFYDVESINIDPESGSIYFVERHKHSEIAFDDAVVEFDTTIFGEGLCGYVGFELLEFLNDFIGYMAKSDRVIEAVSERVITED